jgi:hypothetical protein
LKLTLLSANAGIVASSALKSPNVVRMIVFIL